DRSEVRMRMPQVHRMMRCPDDADPFWNGDLRELREIAPHARESFSAAQAQMFEMVRKIGWRGFFVYPESDAPSVFLVAFEDLIEPLAGCARLESQRRPAVSPGGSVAEHPGDIGIAMNLDAGHIGLRRVPGFEILDDDPAESGV